MEIEEVLNVARTFIAVQLDGDMPTARFLGASYSTGWWTVKCFFEDKHTTTKYIAVLTIGDVNKKVVRFDTQPM